MSNTYVLHDARLVADPETITLPSGDSLVNMRLADNPPHGKDDKRPPRFVKGKVFGKLAESAAKLTKGDIITVSGELGIEAYGEDLAKRADVMRINTFRVQKSESFYGRDAGGDDRPAETKGTKAKGRVQNDPFATE